MADTRSTVSCVLGGCKIRGMRIRYILLFVIALALAGWLHAQQPAFDLLLKNGRIVDGSGSPWFRGDVGIRGDSVALIAPHIDGAATRVIDVSGNVIAPGFTETDMFAKVPANLQAQIHGRIPLNRFAQPVEIARAVIYLAADGDYVTGAQINVNGGAYM